MNVETVENLVRVLSGSSQLTEIEVRQGDVTLRLRRPAPASPPKPSKQPVQKVVSPIAPSALPTAPAGTNTVTISAEFVGIFRTASQNLPAIGSPVTAKQALGQIETMGLMNGVAAPLAGRLQAVFVQDTQPVEYGQPLFEIVPEETK